MSYCEWRRMDPITSGRAHLVGCPTGDADARRAFVARRDLAPLLAEASKTSPAVLELRMSDPVVVAALSEAERQEKRKHDWPSCAFAYECPGCRASAAWGGALFLHLVQCPAYKQLVDAAAPEFA